MRLFVIETFLWDEMQFDPKTIGSVMPFLSIFSSIELKVFINMFSIKALAAIIVTSQEKLKSHLGLYSKMTDQYTIGTLWDHYKPNSTY